MKKFVALSMLSVSMLASVHAQDKSVIFDSVELVDITTVNPHIQVKLYFASDQNFAGKVFYNEYAKAYLRSSVANALSVVQKELEELGLGLVVCDAYRPKSVQKDLWECCPDTEWVVNPNESGCRHHCGFAVDVVLVDLADGSLVQMPCPFFGDPSSRDYHAMPTAEGKRNCKLLELVMEKHGFVGLTTEWWHFDFKSRERCDALDISFQELAERV